MARPTAKFDAAMLESLTGAGYAAPPAPAGIAAAERPRVGRRRLDEACLIDVGRIVADPHQPRKEFDADELDRLASSLRRHGQLQPIRVRWDGGLDRYVVVLGERRWRAAQLAGLPEVACTVLEGSPSAEELLEEQLVENAQRQDLKPIEKAKALRWLMEVRGWTYAELGMHLCLSESAIAKALALLELPAPVQELVEERRIGPAVAYELTKVADDAERLELARQAATGAVTRDQLQARVGGRPRGSKGRGGSRPWAWADPAGRVKVTVAPLAGDVGDDELVEALKQALAALRKRAKGRAA